MGSGESKLSVPSTPKAEPHRVVSTIRNDNLVDPRSPSTCIDRTPIQAVPFSKSSVEDMYGCPQISFDPRSPTIGVVRTPARDAMRETVVGSLARRLGMLFHSEVPDTVSQGHLLEEEKVVEEEGVVEEHRGVVEEHRGVVEEHQGVVEEHEVVGGQESSDEPLLSRQPSQTLTSMAEHATLLTTPVLPIECVGSSSPFVLLEEAQADVYMNTEDLSLEEGEEAKESPLHKRLSMSLITCHEGAPQSPIFTEVQIHKGPASPLVAAPTITITAECPPTPDHVPCLQVAAEDVPVTLASPEQPEEALQVPVEEALQVPVEEALQVPVEEALQVPVEEALQVPGEQQPSTLALPLSSSPAPSQEQARPSTGIQCPTIDPRSPSQVVFKPQWLGKGFGTAGLRAKGVRASKGGSSPLAVRVVVKNIHNENRTQSTKTKQKANGLSSEGRSPLQILKTNSPRDKSQSQQMKLKKASTPDRPRRSQVERRVLTVAMDKEN
ncbi:hypothetical protein NHX12_002041 [Muraenolepis orangiensis]|uniref:Cell division cycle-associated protein 3 n=1 Tax=Muraenolepis orangiensis TaxID=630683 RepID=A0A9Q0E0U5_9TELE|nr:hypothetical protein NHX12_002041 [Muraenolepis orangiensis]